MKEVSTEKEKYPKIPSTAAIGGALITAVMAGEFFGPIGAIVGFFGGGIAGQLFDIRTSQKLSHPTT